MDLKKYKGIHPGAILERELAKRHLAQRPFALLIKEHPQTLNAITKGKRGMNTALALKIEKELGWEEGTLMVLQVYHDIKLEKQGQRTSKQPNLTVFRKALFWDTNMSSIDWEKHARFVITRIFERGNENEKKEIIKFYGPEKIKQVLGCSTIPLSNIPIMRNLKAK